MNPRQIVSQIAQGAARTAVVGALALGFAASILAPATAQAAPATAAAPADLVPAYAGAWTGEGQRVALWPMVKNVGGQTVHGTRMVVSIPVHMTDVTISPSYFTCSMSAGARAKNVIICDTDRDIEPNHSLGIEILGVAPQMPGVSEAIVHVDPENTAHEADMANNTIISPLITVAR